MYNLLIADDEELERRALRYFIKNSNLDIGQIFECASGTAVVQSALTNHPDIMILDIKMPGLTGLEAMEHIILTNKNCKIIFSTAYNYFDYAVKALRLGAMDFMVKPINKETFIGVINKAIDQLDAQRERESSSARLKGLMSVIEKKLLPELIQGNIDEEVLYFLDVMGVDSGAHGNTFFIRFEEPMEENRSSRVHSVLKEDLGRAGCKCLLNLRNNCMTLVAFPQDPAFVPQLGGLVRRVADSVFRDVKARYLLGVGQCFEDLSQIEESYGCARAAAGDVLENTKREGAYGMARETQGERGSDVPQEIQTVCDYLNTHYSEKITLDSVAGIVGFSKYYISRLFKQYKKMTIVDYLIRVRLNKAKELLMDGGYSIKQISGMIGYTDPNYFTWAFKKVEGVSPVKYRYARSESASGSAVT